MISIHTLCLQQQQQEKVCEKHAKLYYMFDDADINLPRTCLDLLCLGYTLSGVYSIHPDGKPLYDVKVYCDQKTNGGGWTVRYYHTCSNDNINASIYAIQTKLTSLSTCTRTKRL